MNNAPPDTLPALTRLNTLLNNIQSHTILIGMTLATLLITIYTMGVMLSGLRGGSASGHRDKWEHLELVLICAAVLGLGPILVPWAAGFVTSLTK